MTLQATIDENSPVKFAPGWLEKQFMKIRGDIVSDALEAIMNQKDFTVGEEDHLRDLVYGTRWKKVKIEVKPDDNV